MGATDGCWSRAVIGAAMALPLVAYAEDPPERGQISLRYLDYQDWQANADRIKVKTSALSIISPITGSWAIGATLINDSISGASPAYHTLALGQLRDHRRATDVKLTHFNNLGSATVGASYSAESDYVSRGITLQLSHATETKNTAWTFGAAFVSDEINPTNRIVRDERKHGIELAAGVTQVVTKGDLLQLNLGLNHGYGYYSDPYKVFDKRPRDKLSQTISARLNHHLRSTDGVLRTSYRYYSDSWKIHAHTLEFQYAQPLSASLTITPLLRLHTQGAASFYVDSDLSTYPFAPNPPVGAAHFSEDQRLSAFGARTVGLKLAKKLGDDWQVDAKAERYVQQSSWRLFGNGSPGLDNLFATTFQFAVAREF